MSVLIRSKGMFLNNYDIGWLELGDDPTCWTGNILQAQRFTQQQAEDLLPAVRQWHEAEIVSESGL